MTDTPETPQEVTPIDRAKFDVHADVDARFTSRVLIPRKRRLVDAYVRTGSYTAAAEASGYSAQTVKKYIHEDKDIQKAIGQIVDQAAVLSGVTLERVLQEYARLAFSDIGELLEAINAAEDSETALAILSDMPADLTSAIKSIDYRRKHEDSDDGAYVDGHLKLTFHDKKGALTDLGRILSVFNDKLTIEDKSAFGERLANAVTKIEGMKGVGDE